MSRRPRGALPAEPPKLAMWLLERRVPEHEREFLVGDLVEGFHGDLARGVAPNTARRRFWAEALRAAVRREADAESIPFWRGLTMDLTLDLRLAARRLRRSPGFTLGASLTLALGIGAACAIVAIVRPAMWGALPFREADRIVTLRESFADGSTGRMGFTTVQDIASRVSGFASVATARDLFATLQSPDGAQRLTGMAVSASWLEVMGVRVPIGRGFLPEEDRPGASRAVMLSDALWRQRFSADTSLVGGTVVLNDVPFQVVGILPPTYESVLLPGVEILMPLRYVDTLDSACRDCRHLQAVARLRPGVSMDDAVRQARQGFEEIRRAYPATYGRNGLVVTPLRVQLLEGMRGAMLALLGAAALLLLIALANTTNLFVARSLGRRSEATLRTALGASRWRITRGMLLEALGVSALGALFGLAVSHAAVGTLVALAPPTLPRLAQVRVDGWVTALGLALAALAVLTCGLVASAFVGGSRIRLQLSGASRTVAGSRQDLVRRGLVALEIALAMQLLGGAGILVRSVQRLMAVDVGFTSTDRLTMALGVGGPRYRSDTAVFAAWRGVMDGVAAIPGVRTAALTSQLPLTSDFDAYGIRWSPVRPRGADGPSDAFRYAVTPGYARAMGLQVRRGRFVDESDVAGGAPVVVISEALARREFGDRDPLGERLQLGPPTSPWRTVVGVVNDVQHPRLDAPRGAAVYLPLEQNAFADGHVRLVVHAGLPPGDLLPQVRAAIRSADPAITVAEVATLDEVVTETARQRLFARRLFQVFSASALLLAAIGIFGVVAGVVGERTREIGVRAAMGASRRQIVGHFVRQGGAMIVAGIAGGIVGALALGSAMRSLVFGVSPHDPVTLVAVSAGLAFIALVASWWPARRAALVDPAIALRSD